MSSSTDDRSVYLRHIRSCYRYHPEAASFYEQLADFLDACSGQRKSRLQEVKLFEISPLSNDDVYPKAFPFITAGLHDENCKPRIGVLQGFPHPDCIAFLGAEFAVRPEFFIEHLPVSLKLSDSVPELPTLPSRQDNVVRVHFSRLVKPMSPYPSRLSGQTSLHMRQKRAEMEGLRLNYEKALVNHRIVEEMVSFTIATHRNNWHGIFLTDSSRMVTEQGLPWSRHGGIVPLVPYNLPAESSAPIPSRDDGESSGQLDQFHPLKGIVLRDQVDYQLMQEDPFFLLATVLTTSFLSWSQTLNVLAQGITECQDQLDVDQDKLQFQLGQLRQHVATISRVKELLSENQHIITEGGCSSWPKPASDSTIKRKELIQRKLQADYDRMMERCKLLTGHCESATSVLVGFAQLVLSERGVQSANEVNMLTRMASFFIPLSFITGVFGMNIREWSPPPSWQWPFGCGIGIYLLTLSVLYGPEWIRKIKNYYVTADIWKFRR
ncbi:hypothetical protein CBS147332_143 [Penicillium roqueforti]|nr:hypothetical protein CBS147332_143 [Penicillium roqueforti]KAI3121018.1 hypothetical protein CBS147331_2237 [Penicillium roqueforti]